MGYAPVDAEASGEKVIVGFVGKSDQGNIAAHNSKIPLTAGKRFKVISFFTKDNEYADLAARLESGLKKFGLEYDLIGIPSSGAWELNCAFKARFVRDQWEKSDIPVVWTDADSTIERDPVLFSKLDCDLALHKWDDWQFCSGTAYFGKSHHAKALLDQWVLRCDADPVTWDQTSLQLAWMDVSSVIPLRTVWLPRPYTAIFDKDTYGDPVIKHWQASRKPKKEGRTTGKPQFAILPAFMDDARNNRVREEQTARAYLGADIRPGPPKEFYRELGPVVAGLGLGLVAEVGCGEGELANYLRPEDYLGLEANPHKVLKAKESHPSHDFRCFEAKMGFPGARTIVFPLTFIGGERADAAATLLRATERSHTIVVAGTRSDEMMSVFRQVEGKGFRVTSVHPMKFSPEAGDDSLSIVVLRRTFGSRLQRRIRRLMKIS